MSKTILLVDDSLAMRKVLQTHLAQAGYQLAVAESGPSAIQTAHKHPPQLILLDHQVPESDGAEICRQFALDSALRSIPILISSQISDDQFQAYRRFPLVMGKLQKPFTAARLLTQIEQTLALPIPAPADEASLQLNVPDPAPGSPPAKTADVASSEPANSTLQIMLLDESGTHTELIRSLLDQAIPRAGLTRDQIQLRTSATPALARVMIRKLQPQVIIFNVANEAFAQLVAGLVEQSGPGENRTMMLVGLQPKSDTPPRPPAGLDAVLTMPCNVKDIIGVLLDAGMEFLPAPGEAVVENLERKAKSPEDAESTSTQVACHACGTLNDEAARTCSKCLAALIIHCPSCNRLTRVDSDQCQSCGIQISKFLEARHELNRAKDLLLDNQFDRAIQIAASASGSGYLISQFNRVVKEASTRRDKLRLLCSQAVEHFEGGRFLQARVLIEDAMKLAPDQSDLELLYSEINDRLLHAEADQLFDSALVMVERRNLDEALETLHQVTTLMPGFEGAEELAGEITVLIRQRDARQRLIDIEGLLSQKKLEEAKHALTDARRLDADPQQLAALTERLNEMKHAQSLEKMISKIRGMLENGDMDNAAAMLDNLKTLEPNHPALEDLWKRHAQTALDSKIKKLNASASVKISTGDLDGAAQILNESHDLDHSREDTHQLFERLEAKRMSVRAKTARDKAIAALGAGDFEEAKKRIDEAVAIDPTSAENASVLRQIEDTRFQRQSDNKSMFKAIQQLMDEGQLEAASSRLNQAMLSAGQTPELKTLSSKLTRLKQEAKLKPLLEQAERQILAEDYAAAEESLRSALKIDPSRAQSRQLASVLVARVKERTMKQHLDAAASMLQKGDIKGAEQRLATVRTQDPNRSDAVPLWEKLQSMKREQWVSNTMLEANESLAKGDLAEAESKAHKVLDALPGHAGATEILQQVAAASVNRNDQDTAVSSTEAGGPPGPASIDSSATGSPGLKVQPSDDLEPIELEDEPSTSDPLPAKTSQSAPVAEPSESTPKGRTVQGASNANPAADNSESSMGTISIASETRTEPAQVNEDDETTGLEVLEEDESRRDFANSEAAVSVTSNDGIKWSIEMNELIDEVVNRRPANAPKIEPVKPIGKYHWMVTSAIGPGSPLGYAMDQSVTFNGLPIKQDVMFLDPNNFGAFPRRGPHEIFYRHGGYHDWSAKLDEWLKLHEKRIKKHFEKLYPPDRAAPIPTFMVFGRLGWQAQYEATGNTPSDTVSPLAVDSDYHDDWEEFIKSVNKTWDYTFLKLIGFEAPAGTKGFDDLLVGGQRRRFLRKALMSDAWEYFVKLFTLSTLRICRQIFPDAQYGFMGYPPTLSLADPVDIRAKQVQHQNMNDKLEWLYKATDFVAPRTLVSRVTVPNTQKPDLFAKQNSMAIDIQTIEYNVGEAVRLRDRFAPGRPVLSIHPYQYTQSAGGKWLNDINLAHNFRLPLAVGADGILIMGHITNQAEQKLLQSEINGRMGKLIKAATQAAG